MPLPEPEKTVMPLGEHLEELRRRVWLAIVGIIPVFVIGLVFGRGIIQFIVRPLEDAFKRESAWGGTLQITGVLESFMNYLKVAGLIAVVIGAPWIIYQLWRFIAPGLYARERRFFYLLGPMSVVLSLLGVAFMYYVMLPFVLTFFVSFNQSFLTRVPSPLVDVPPGLTLPVAPVLEGDPRAPTAGQMWINRERGALRFAVGQPGAAPDAAPLLLSLPLQSDSLIAQQYKVNEYVNLVLAFALAFALTFQTPVVVLLLGWAGIIDAATLPRYRKHAVMICAIVAAVVTPPDAISMLTLAVPMYVLFELGLILLRILPAHRVAAGVLSRRAESRPGSV